MYIHNTMGQNSHKGGFVPKIGKNWGPDGAASLGHAQSEPCYLIIGKHAIVQRQETYAYPSLPYSIIN